MKVRFLAALVLCACLSAQTPGGLETRLDAKIAAAVKKSGAPSVSVAVVEDGKLAFARAYGMADLATRRAADMRTRYSIGSISKQFTAAALLLLQEQHKLSLDDKVAKYFPNLRRAGDISIRQLLSHTSGYEDYAPQDYIIPEWTREITPAALLDRWAMKPLNFEPGTKWQYSNTNYVLASQIFEKASGEALIAFLRAHVFDPLGMISANSWPPVLPGDAVAYTRYAVGPPRPVAREASGWYYGAGSLAMTPSDLAKWDIAFLEKKILSAQSYEEFTREAMLANGDRTHYALGLSLGDTNGAPYYQHGGETSGFISSNTVYPTRRAAVVVLTNIDGVNFAGPLAKQIATVLLGPEEAQESKKDTAQAREILEGLRKGKLDRALFTENANSYFSEAALKDFRASLAPLGRLKEVTFASENLRGGMKHRSYHAVFDEKTLSLNVYVTPEGKYEQFLVEGDL